MSLPKIIKLIFVLIFVFQLIGLAIIFIIPQVTHAAGISFTPQVEIPGFSSVFKGQVDGNSIGNYIKVIYKYAIGIVGILATIVMMIGGFMWLLAAGNQSKISEAQDWIKASITGLILALGSYMILATVNPALVTFKSITPQTVTEVGCCTYVQSGEQLNTPLSESDCNAKGGSYNKTCTASPEEATLLSASSCPSGYKPCQKNGTGYIGNCEVMGRDRLGHEILCQAAPSTGDIIPTSNPSSADSDTSVCSDPLRNTDKLPCSTPAGGIGYCLNHTCHTCKPTGATCTGPWNYNYECCSGDCQGTFSYSCK